MVKVGWNNLSTLCVLDTVRIRTNEIHAAEKRFACGRTTTVVWLVLGRLFAHTEHFAGLRETKWFVTIIKSLFLILVIVSPPHAICGDYI